MSCKATRRFPLTAPPLKNTFVELESGQRPVEDRPTGQPVRMSPRQAAIAGVLAAAFAAAAIAVAHLLPGNRPMEPLVLAALVALLAAASRIELEVGRGHGVPVQLVFVPMLFLAPLPLVPLLVGASFLLAAVPDFVRRGRPSGRWPACLSDCWFAVGPVLVLALLAPGAPALEHAGVYLLAFGAQAVTRVGAAVVHEGLGRGLAAAHALRAAAWSCRIDAILSPLAFLVALVAVDEPLSVAAVGPLLWLLSVFSSERRQRCTARLELNRAYRGTVMLLADLVDADDDHTGDHSRAVVELVSALADELDVHAPEREELEFVALLHDVGKISIPKTILNKPAALTEDEYALMKTHTVEGQGLLDRVGGPLGRIGETVRSCHERWDGTGYPDGLAGPDIPWAARIVFACDAYDAMTTDRPYRRALSRETALQEMWANAGHQFEARIVTALSNVVRSGRVAVAPPRTQDVRTLLASAAVPAGLAPAHEDPRSVAEPRSRVAVGTAVA